MNNRPNYAGLIIVLLIALWLMQGGQTPFTLATGPVSILIVEETADRPKLPPSQLEILTSTELRTWAATHCAKGDDGQPELRILDRDADVSRMPQKWQDAFNVARTKSTPNITITNGKGGTSGDLQLTVKDVITEAEKWSGK